MARSRIPFNKPSLVGPEQEYMAEAVRRGHLSGDGHFTAACQQVLEQETGCAKALLTTSCTHALEMTALLLDLQPGDEVILPSFTFVSTVNAYVLRGATPVFVDIRPDTLNIDETLLASAITSRTRAIVVVHYAGVGCAMQSICDIAERHDVTVIEDNAHGLFGKYRGRPLGSFGRLATQSFHETKNVICGEGGALLLNDPALVERAEIVREKGTNRARFFRGQVDKYSWVDAGSSYLPSDLLAAFLLAQLEHRQAIQQRRREIWDTYARKLDDWAHRQGVRLPFVPDDCSQAYHMFYLLMPTLEHRQHFIERLRKDDISAVFHYVPLHTSQKALDLGIAAHCPVTEDVSNRLVRLPFYNSMTEQEQQTVVEAITACSW